MKGLIGYTGFVGSNLLKQTNFDALYNSANIDELNGRDFETLVCSGISAVKWLANKHPETDWIAIKNLLRNLQKVSAKRLIIISTVDVYPIPRGVTESVCCDNLLNDPYGAHRLAFEQEACRLFSNVTIVRLPALFGTGLKKNILFDLICKRLLANIALDSSFQWYPVGRLWEDIQKVVNSECGLLNFATEPIATKEICTRWFSQLEVDMKGTSIAHYDIRTDHSRVFGRDDGYIIGKSEIFKELEKWISSPGIRCA